MRDWGTILVATRLEKQVSARFFQVWMELTKSGLRDGDGALSVRGKVAHKAQNDIVRHLLRGTWDTLLTLDSDADVKPEFLEAFRSYQPGWEYDIFQAFYTRRGWPPRAIWMKQNALGQMMEYFVTDPELTEDVDIAGTHALLIRREVFETLLGNGDVNLHEWFYYPRHTETSEDSAFSHDAKAAGFRIGATSAIRAGHICEITTGWETYQDYLRFSGKLDLLKRHSDLAQMIAEFTGETPQMVLAKAAQGPNGVRAAWNDVTPVTVDDERAFYGNPDNGYLYDLLSWNCQPYYERLIHPLYKERGKNILVIGTGLGTEADILADANNVDCFELPGVLRDFAKQRLGDRVAWVEADKLTPDALSPGVYDLVIAIDTLEHVHPSELPTVLGAIRKALRPGGTLYAHNSWDNQETYPMHHDNGTAFDEWAERVGMVEMGQMQWVKSSKSGRIIKIDSTHSAQATSLKSQMKSPVT